VTTGRGDHEVHKGHVVALGKETPFLQKMTFAYLVKKYPETKYRDTYLI
jgi:hypothetical protein